jgi:hypothetical protein
VAKLWYSAELPWPMQIGEHWTHQLRLLGHHVGFGVGGGCLEIVGANWITFVSTKRLFEFALAGEGERIHLAADPPCGLAGR